MFRKCHLLVQTMCLNCFCPVNGYFTLLHYRLAIGINTFAEIGVLFFKLPLFIDFLFLIIRILCYPNYLFKKL